MKKESSGQAALGDSSFPTLGGKERVLQEAGQHLPPPAFLLSLTLIFVWLLSPNEALHFPCHLSGLNSLVIQTNMEENGLKQEELCVRPFKDLQEFMHQSGL